MLLGLIGGATGCLLGLWLVRVIGAAYPGAIPGLTGPAINLQVLLFVFAVSLLASVLFGSIPAIQASDCICWRSLWRAAGTPASVHRQRFRSFLVISEVALAMILLAAAGLLIRSFILLHRVDPGFDSSNLAVVRLSLPDSRYPELPQRTQFVNLVLERLRTLPGVQSVAAAGTLPFDPAPTTDLELEGHALRARERARGGNS